MLNHPKGFTFVELMLLIGIIGIVATIATVGLGLLAGNYWGGTDEAVFHQLNREKREKRVERRTLILVDRNIFAYSRIVVEEDGQEVVYCYGSNLLQDITFEPCPDD